MNLDRLIATIDADAPVARRHLWLMDALAWVRGDAVDVSSSVARVRAFVTALQTDPDALARWRRWLRCFVQTVDITPLLADHGFAPRTAFLSEFGHRLRRKVLPGTPESTDLAELFLLLLPSPFDVRWIKALDSATLKAFGTTLPEPSDTGNRADFWRDELMDALTFCVSQTSATGFATEIRIRMSDEAQRDRPFHELPSTFETLRRAVRSFGQRSPEALAAAEALREQLDACRHAAYSVYSHLEEHGVSVGIVFRLRQLRERIVRIKQLLDCLQSDQPERAIAALLADLVQGGLQQTKPAGGPAGFGWTLAAWRWPAPALRPGCGLRLGRSARGGRI